MIAVAARHVFHAPSARSGAPPGFTLDAAFTAPPGVVALFGPSGAGKSTLLTVVAGLLRPHAGQVTLDGATLLDTASGIDLPAERRRCGVVFQDARLFPHMAVRANLQYGLRRAPPGTAGPSLDEVVDLLGLAPMLDRRPRHLSGGERQRVALGRALLARPRLLLMDEPLAALDSARKAEVLPFLDRMRAAAGVPILYVTHALDEVDRLAETLVLMEAGRVVACGPVEALSARTDLPGFSTRRDAGAALPCVVAGHDPGRGLTRIAFDGGHLLVPLRPEPQGTRLRLRVRARDVALATEAPRHISLHNVLPGTITAIDAAGLHEVLVTVKVGGVSVLARITRNAVATLGLVSGQAVFALIKSTAFDHGG